MHKHLANGLFALLAFAPIAAHASSQIAMDSAFAQAPGLRTEVSDSNTTTTNPVHPPGQPGSYFDWGRGQNGWGYCYEWSYDGYVLNGGRPVANYLCESARPSSFNWGRGGDGWGYCYQWTPNGIPMNEGRPVGNYSCERTAPSYYQWGRANDGYTYCYQWAPNGLVLNQGRPVPNYNCQSR